MRTADQWQELLRVEADFLRFEKAVLAGELQDYRQIDPVLFSRHGWDLIPQQRLFQMLLPFLRQQLVRAQEEMSLLYLEGLKNIDSKKLISAVDWNRIPLLTKNDAPQWGLKGFREIAQANPHILKPSRLQEAWIPFGSGGSTGRHTPTFVTLADREREIQAWRRGHDYHGLMAGDTALFAYNTTHKGGQWMQESLLRHSINVLIRRPEEGPQKILENIKNYQANALFTVQQPYEAMTSQTKAAGINLHSLIMESLANPQYKGLLIPDDKGKRCVEFVFLGGFEIIPYAMKLVSEYLQNVPVATLLGSSEAIPQACSTNPSLTPHAACHFNNLHLLQGPHFVEVVKRSGESWIPVQKGEEGLLVYTSWARDGTIWIRYAPGDVATLLLNEGECPCGLHSPVITNVHRESADERAAILVNGCAAG